MRSRLFDVLDEYAAWAQAHGLSRDSAEGIFIRVRLEKPTSLEYSIEGLPRDELKRGRSWWDRNGTRNKGSVVSNFSYTTQGDVYFPSQLRQLRCQFDINRGSLSDYVEYSARGLIGYGWYLEAKDNADLVEGHLNLSLRLAPNCVRDLLEGRVVAEKITRPFYEAEEVKGPRTIWMRLGLDLVNFRESNRADGKVYFDIRSLETLDSDSGPEPYD
jgi:hypothetical protein